MVVQALCGGSGDDLPGHCRVPLAGDGIRVGQLDVEPDRAGLVLVDYGVGAADTGDHRCFVILDGPHGSVIRQGGVLGGVAELDCEGLVPIMDSVILQNHREGLLLLPNLEVDRFGPGIEVLAQAGGGHVGVGRGVAVNGGRVYCHLFGGGDVQAHREIQLSGGLAGLGVVDGEGQVVVVNIVSPDGVGCGPAADGPEKKGCVT